MPAPPVRFPGMAMSPNETLQYLTERETDGGKFIFTASINIIQVIKSYLGLLIYTLNANLQQLSVRGLKASIM